MITNLNKIVLDYNQQGSRLFSKFFINLHTTENFDGIADIIILHREGMQDTFEDVKKYSNDNTIFLVDITTESGRIDIFLNYFKTLTDSLPNKFYLFADTDITNYTKNIKIKYDVISGFELIFYAFLTYESDSFITVNKLNNVEYKNGFMSLNGNLRIQRILLLLEFIKNGVDTSNCTFLFYINTPEGYKFNLEEYHTMITELLNTNIITEMDYHILNKIKSPIYIDYDSSEPISIKNTITDIYTTPINFVTENVTGLVGGDDSLYGLITFTEKTLKPFLAYQIPMIFGLYGLNDELRKLGFDLFDDVINHKIYENEKDTRIRMKLMVTELQRVLELDNLEFKNKNAHRFINNHIRCYELANKGFDILNNFHKTTLL
jgi:hypothetical protein